MGGQDEKGVGWTGGGGGGRGGVPEDRVGPG